QPAGTGNRLPARGSWQAWPHVPLWAARLTTWVLAAILTNRASSPEEVDEPLPIALTWQAPEACPPADEVVRRLAPIVAHTLELRSDATTVIDVVISAGPTGFDLALTVRSSSGTSERQISGPQCVGVLDAAAVVTATRILADLRASEHSIDATVVPTP